MVPLGGRPLTVNACPQGATSVTATRMDDGGIAQALDRAERALERIERALAERRDEAGRREDELRAKVRDAVSELDQLIRASGS